MLAASTALNRFESLAVSLRFTDKYQKTHFARKIRVKSWRTAQNKKKPAPSSLARILNIILLRTGG